MAILKFGSIFKKSFAHPHVARNVILKLNFSKALKKSPAHLHIMGNVIVKFE